MTKTYQPGERCQVVTAHGQWLDATIISTREGHGGALVRVDGWVTDVWAKPSEIRQILRVVPEPDPHSTAYQGEVGDHQPRVTETVAKYGHVAKDDDLQYWRISQDENSGEVNVELTAQLPTLGVIGETIGKADPSLTCSEATALAYGRDPYAPPRLQFNPDYGQDVNGTFTKLKVDPWARLREMADKIIAPKSATTAAVAVAATLQMDEALTRLGAVTNSTREKIGYIEAAADFAMMGITPEQLRDYISAFAHTIVTGATPEEVERFARQTLRDKCNRADEGLHHITREYRGAR